MASLPATIASASEIFWQVIPLRRAKLHLGDRRQLVGLDMRPHPEADAICA